MPSLAGQNRLKSMSCGGPLAAVQQPAASGHSRQCFDAETALPRITDNGDLPRCGALALPSAPEATHHSLGVALSRGDADWESSFHLRDFSGSQLDVERFEVLFQVRSAFGARDRDHLR